MPRFSIIVPCRNAVGNLNATIETVQAQTFTDWEMILVDDGSTDGTPGVAARAEAADPRISAIRQENAGPSVARNNGAARATGELLAFLDADDLWSPDRLAIMDQVFCREEAPDAAYSPVSFFKRTPSEMTVRVTPRAGTVATEDCLYANPSCTMSNVVVTRSAFRASGGFHIGLRQGETLEWLIRLTHAARMVSVEGGEVYCRAGDDARSADLPAMRAGWNAAYRTALALGVDPEVGRRAEAAHLRHLAWWALRLDAREALSFALTGCRTSLAGFFSSPSRGAATLVAALLAPAAPRGLRRVLFA